MRCMHGVEREVGVPARLPSIQWEQRRLSELSAAVRLKLLGLLPFPCLQVDVLTSVESSCSNWCSWIEVERCSHNCLPLSLPPLPPLLPTLPLPLPVAPLPCSSRTFFMCRIDLTDEGQAHVGEAVGVIFRWVGGLGGGGSRQLRGRNWGRGVGSPRAEEL